jgi:ferric-dicitrate binding protein FerR (iron transport regulator)
LSRYVRQPIQIANQKFALLRIAGLREKQVSRILLPTTGTKSMQRKRAIAVAISKTQERNRVLTIAAGLLLLPAALLLLLISP